MVFVNVLKIFGAELLGEVVDNDFGFHLFAIWRLDLLDFFGHGLEFFGGS